MEKILSNKSINDTGYYPLSDCDLLCFTGNCPREEYEIISCEQCPFEKEKGNDYFQMDEFYTMPIKEAISAILSRVE
jgi:hypothetical protein